MKKENVFVKGMWLVLSVKNVGLDILDWRVLIYMVVDSVFVMDILMCVIKLKVMLEEIF